MGGTRRDTAFAASLQPQGLPCSQQRAIQRSPGTVHLRPVALSQWLNDVETHNRIQYSQTEISTHENRT